MHLFAIWYLSEATWTDIYVDTFHQNIRFCAIHKVIRVDNTVNKFLISVNMINMNIFFHDDDIGFSMHILRHQIRDSTFVIILAPSVEEIAVGVGVEDVEVFGGFEKG